MDRDPRLETLAAALGLHEDEARREHRMNSLPPRTDKEKQDRALARKVRRCQKRARRRNRR